VLRNNGLRGGPLLRRFLRAVVARLLDRSPRRDAGNVYPCLGLSVLTTLVAGGKPSMTPIAFRRNGSMWGTTKALIPGQATSFDSALRSRSVT
jgi:hypothetical protein